MEERPFVESLKGMRIGGRYVIDKVLSSGGMGVVATARYPELQQKVAIKFLRPQHASPRPAPSASAPPSPGSLIEDRK